jgi:hypothetical protein
MPPEYLHHHPDFAALLRIIGEECAIAPALVEKDYWIMHCLYALQQTGMTFELKGGTSLSKGYGIIGRFSEDIDIRIEPPAKLEVKTGRNQNKPAHCESRKHFYNWLAATLAVDGIEHIERDTAFDDAKYRSGGIRLRYRATAGPLPPDLRDGILLEVGFDDVTPNAPQDISSWAYDYAAERVDVIDNRAKGIPCYHPGYTLVEKLQTISTKFRQQQQDDSPPESFMRHYYDVYCLLQAPEVQAFIGTPEYMKHKQRRFRSGDHPVIAENDAFLLSNPATRQAYEQAYQRTSALYYSERPAFATIMDLIREWAERL